MKSTIYRSQIRFSDWIESMRKDVECAFGILKGRWRILKYGIRLLGMKRCDGVWLTCCALHNLLLEIDGLAEGWENGVQSHWEMEPDRACDIPFALKRLRQPAKARTYDLSGIGVGNDIDYDAEDNVDDHADEINSIVSAQDSDGNIGVQKISLGLF